MFFLQVWPLLRLLQRAAKSTILCCVQTAGIVRNIKMSCIAKIARYYLSFLTIIVMAIIAAKRWLHMDPQESKICVHNSLSRFSTFTELRSLRVLYCCSKRCRSWK